MAVVTSRASALVGLAMTCACACAGDHDAEGPAPHAADTSVDEGPSSPAEDAGSVGEDASVSPPSVRSDEPPSNPFLADSPWPMPHRNPYCQASSPLPAPIEPGALRGDAITDALGAVTVVFSNPDAEGRRVAWSTTLDDILKIDLAGEELTLIDKTARESASGGSLSGAYSLMDRDGVFFAPRGATMFAYTDATRGDLRSKIRLRDRFDLPPDTLSADDDAIVGINLTYDGWLAFATSHGTVGVLARDFSALHTLMLGAGEDVSNSIAVDEDGGIYVVTSAHMHRVQWTGSEVTLDPAQGAWTSRYEVGPADQATGRLGSGSGTTPTLVGTRGQDRLVAIADGQSLMNVVLFWRDQIPDGWEPIAQGKDRRIAAEVPLLFGDASRQKSVTEQSLLVRGYGVMAVNNDYGALPDLPGESEVTLTNLPMYAPFGAEKLEWDPATRRLVRAWANAEVSCPNGIPAMSAASSLAYCVGQRSSVWTFEALDWDTGASVFSIELGALPQFNSAYGAAEIGPDGVLYSGGLRGPFRAVP